MQARCVPGRIQSACSSGSKAEGMVMIASASAQSRSRSTASKGRPISSATAASFGSISGWGFQASTPSKGWISAAARSWNCDWCPAPTMPSTRESLRARCAMETADAAAVRSAVRWLPPTSAFSCPVSGSNRNTVDWWLVMPRARLPGQ